MKITNLSKQQMNSINSLVPKHVKNRTAKDIIRFLYDRMKPFKTDKFWRKSCYKYAMRWRLYEGMR